MPEGYSGIPSQDHAGSLATECLVLTPPLLMRNIGDAHIVSARMSNILRAHEPGMGSLP